MSRRLFSTDAWYWYTTAPDAPRSADTNRAVHPDLVARPESLPAGVRAVTEPKIHQGQDAFLLVPVERQEPGAAVAFRAVPGMGTARSPGLRPRTTTLPR
jgi:hypothetical protein